MNQQAAQIFGHGGAAGTEITASFGALNLDAAAGGILGKGLPAAAQQRKLHAKVVRYLAP
jgi:hypothetical protein